MAQLDVVGQLRQRFDRPLDDFAQRRIVVWHDPEGEFAETFAELSGPDGVAFSDEGFPGGPVRCLELADGNTFDSKRLICRDAADANFLLYRRRSRAALEGDWIADVSLYADHFQADYASLLMEDVGISDTVELRQMLGRVKGFFAAQDRIARYRALMPHAQAPQQLAMGVLAAALHAKAPTVETVVRAYLSALLAEARDAGCAGAAPAAGEAEALPKPLADLRKYGADEMFAGFLKAKLGYAGDPADADALAAHLLVSAASVTMPSEVLVGLEGHMAAGNAQFCLGVFRDWAAQGPDARAELLDMCRGVEGRLLLAKRFANARADQLLESDVFPCINEALLMQYMASVAGGADRGDEVLSALRARRELEWYEAFRPYFDCLAAAVQMNAFKAEHPAGFHETDPKAVWAAYVQDWWRMDSRYRAFSNACRLCNKRGNQRLDQPLHDMAERMDNLYANWFLSGANACWVKAASGAWEAAGYVSGVGLQRRFYDDYVSAELTGGAKRVVVCVSDALRYEVARQAAAQLDRAMRGTSKVDAVQAAFPSETRFGMAALLPHSQMQFSEATGEVLVDGMSTKGTEARQAVLRARRPKSLAVQYSDLVGMSTADRKKLVADAEVVYVYHNTIDAAGHGEQSGQDVFDACEDAVSDMVDLVRLAVNSMGASRVIVTADHGFLHTRNDIPESQMASRDEVSGELFDVERRYLRAAAGASSEVFVNMRMDDVDGGAYTWWSPRECVRIKASGSRSFVHGGVSLQELCVPVLRYRDARAGSKGFEERTPAELRLLSQARRITSMMFRVDLYQTAPADGKVVPAEYALSMVDAAGNEVSDVRTVHADMTSADEAARVATARFNLKPGVAYSAKDVYTLVCRNRATSEISWQERYQIDIAFAPADDFGF